MADQDRDEIPAEQETDAFEGEDASGHHFPPKIDSDDSGESEEGPGHTGR